VWRVRVGFNLVQSLSGLWRIFFPPPSYSRLRSLLTLLEFGLIFSWKAPQLPQKHAQSGCFKMYYLFLEPRWILHCPNVNGSLVFSWFSWRFQRNLVFPGELLALPLLFLPTQSVSMLSFPPHSSVCKFARSNLLHYHLSLSTLETDSGACGCTDRARNRPCRGLGPCEGLDAISSM